MKTLLCVLPALNQLSPSGVLRIAVPLFQENGVECELLATGETVGLHVPAFDAAGYYSQVLSDAPRSSSGMTSPG